MLLMLVDGMCWEGSDGCGDDDDDDDDDGGGVR